MNLNWTTHGEGPPLVFLHAFPFSSKMWSGCVNLTEECGFRYLAVDFPGFGKSRGLIRSLGDTAELLLEDLVELGAASAAFCGISMGGYVLMEILNLQPSCVTNAIYCDTSPIPDNRLKKESRRKAIERIEKDGPDEYITEMAGLLTSSTIIPEKLSDIISRMNEARPVSMIAAQEAMLKRGSYEHLFVTPSGTDFLIFGKDDPSYSDIDSFKSVHEERRFVIEDCGHFSVLERPTEFEVKLRKALEIIRDE